jgi:hypothetical protein
MGGGVRVRWRLEGGLKVEVGRRIEGGGWEEDWRWRLGGGLEVEGGRRIGGGGWEEDWRWRLGGGLEVEGGWEVEGGREVGRRIGGGGLVGGWEDRRGEGAGVGAGPGLPCCAYLVLRANPSLSHCARWGEANTISIASLNGSYLASLASLAPLAASTTRAVGSNGYIKTVGRVSPAVTQVTVIIIEQHRALVQSMVSAEYGEWSAEYGECRVW